MMNKINMKQEVFVITNPELGWDCVCEVFSGREQALEYLREISLDLGDDDIEEWAEENNYIIHEKNFKINLMQNFIVVDIETTGINWSKDQMVSLGAVCSETGDEFYGECRIYKWNRITETALKINGFTEEQCRDTKKQTPLQLYYKFRKWCEGRSKILAGHNLGSFDVQFLKLLEYKTKFNKWPFQYSYIDLHSVAFGHFKESLSHKKICERLGIEPEPTPHNALEGARSEMRCLKLLLNYEQENV